MNYGEDIPNCAKSLKLIQLGIWGPIIYYQGTAKSKTS